MLQSSVSAGLECSGVLLWGTGAALAPTAEAGVILYDLLESRERRRWKAIVEEGNQVGGISRFSPRNGAPAPAAGSNGGINGGNYGQHGGIPLLSTPSPAGGRDTIVASSPSGVWVMEPVGR